MPAIQIYNYHTIARSDLGTYSVPVLPTLQIECVFSQRGNIVHGGTIYSKIIECLLPFIMTFLLPRLSIYCISGFLFVCLFVFVMVDSEA